MATKNKIFLKLCLAFGCRNGEVRRSEKKDFDLKKRIWTVPPENHKLGRKSGEPLLRPIIKELVPLIEQAMMLSDCRYLIPCEDKHEPFTSSASLSLPYNLMQWLRKKSRHKYETLVNP
ncbi:hypothetical protein [Endozoicomonas ascidiicola]|uniref:hypothetical protein n=1 Tax=Endozoicomonas ascidiicola TaxID=1698521 RepID=UPI000A6399D3|nr:hypothetical protein [Endozoicomonas ascidiicola]